MHVSESELRDRIVQVRHWRENADFSKLFWISDRNGCLFPQYIIQVITRVWGLDTQIDFLREDASENRILSKRDL